MLFNNLSIVQFGCGGTGSYLGQPIIKFLNNLQNRYITNFNAQYFIIDGDYVTARNILRQNFTEDHIGRNKSNVIKTENDYFEHNYITSIQYNIETKMQMEKFFEGSYKKITFKKPIQHNSICIILGCVDNNKCRRLIFNYMKNNSNKQIIYLDSGNNLYNGQIITTIFNNQLKQSLGNINYKNINFLKYFPSKIKEVNDQSCAFFGDQSQSINMFASTLLFMNIQKLIIEEKLPPNKIEFNSSGFSTFEI